MQIIYQEIGGNLLGKIAGYTREDVHVWLKDAGFIIEEEFGGCDRRPFTGEPGWDIVWARKL